MTSTPLTRCYRCGQCTDLAAQVSPVMEWLCYPCLFTYLEATGRGAL